MQYLQPNTTLQGGKYRIERVLGQGGFGITYLAEQVALHRFVAIKEFFMKENCQRDEDSNSMTVPSDGGRMIVDGALHKFRQEALKLASISHPNIVRVIDVFDENDTAYYVMDYIPGGSLSDYVKKNGPMSEEYAMGYIRQIAGALKYMHTEKHMCHFDVKPSNIMLDGQGHAFLIDFGISKNYSADGHATSSMPVGLSEGYAPVEQYSQSVSEFSPAVDVYALGATLYFLLHGKSPVNAPSRAGGTILLMNKNLSQEVKNAINSSMKVSKVERAQNMDVFLQPYSSGDETTLFVGGNNNGGENNGGNDPGTNGDNGDKGHGIIIVSLLALVAVVVLVLIALFGRGSDEQNPSGQNFSSMENVLDSTPSNQDVAPPDKIEVRKAMPDANGHYTYRGKIGTLSITMKLNPNTEVGDVAGYYTYNNRVKTVFTLAVSEKTGSRLVLDEYRPDGVNCGTYYGTLQNGGDCYRGTFVNYEGREFDFIVNRE